MIEQTLRKANSLLVCLIGRENHTVLKLILLTEVNKIRLPKKCYLEPFRINWDNSWASA